jgi:hypothetical protein
LVRLDYPKQEKMSSLVLKPSPSLLNDELTRSM